MTTRWSDADESVLREFHDTETYATIGLRLNRSVAAVRNRCWRLGMRKKADDWSVAEVARVRSAYEGRAGAPIYIHALSKELGRSPSCISMKARDMGLSSMTRKRPDDFGARMAGKASQWHAEHEHPKGMLGKRHSETTRALMATAQQANVANGTHPGLRPRTDADRAALSVRSVTQMKSEGHSMYSRCKHGRRADLGNQFFRSAWEANYARFLNFLCGRSEIATWEYEADTFWFAHIRRGVRSYTPDFKVMRPDGTLYYVEVKGWMDAKSKTKLARMKRCHPAVEVQLFDARAYRELAKKMGPWLPGWEK